MSRKCVSKYLKGYWGCKIDEYIVDANHIVLWYTVYTHMCLDNLAVDKSFDDVYCIVFSIFEFIF